MASAMWRREERVRWRGGCTDKGCNSQTDQLLTLHLITATCTPVEEQRATMPSPTIDPAGVGPTAVAPGGRVWSLRSGAIGGGAAKGVKWATEETTPKLPSSTGLELTLVRGGRA